MLLKYFGLRSAMMISICSVILIAFTGAIALVTVKATRMAEAQAIDQAKEMARRHAAEVKDVLEGALHTAHALATAMEGIKHVDAVPDRNLINGMMKQAIEEHPDFVGMGTAWEPNALDAKDSAFANTPGHDASGRFIPYWSRGPGGEGYMEPLVDYEKEGDGDWYLIPRQTKKDTLTEPYLYPVGDRMVLMTTLSSPIIIENRFLGVVTADIALDQFEKTIDKVHPFQTGYGMLLSNQGVVIAHPDKEIIGKRITEATRLTEEDLQPVRKGQESVEFRKALATGDDSYTILTPVKVGDTDSPWSFGIIVPEARVMAKAHNMLKWGVIIGIISLILLIGVVFALSQAIIGPLKQVSTGLGDNAHQVAAASDQFMAASRTLSDGSSQQAASVQEISSSLEEIAAMTRQNAENARQADTLMKEADQSIQEATASMVQLNDAIGEIEGASEETRKIVKTIEEIAFQTNLLALNAAVEAARAGEAGAGFAVVAEEVRNLALRSGEAVRNTGALIDGTVQKVGDGTHYARKVNDVFPRISESASKIAEVVKEIVAASAEQTRGIDEVNRAVTEIDKVAQQNAANAEESSAASEKMTELSLQLNRFVRQLLDLIKDKNRKNRNDEAGFQQTGPTLNASQTVGHQANQRPLLERRQNDRSTEKP